MGCGLLFVVAKVTAVCPEVSGQSTVLHGAGFVIVLLPLLLVTLAVNVVMPTRIAVTPAWGVVSLCIRCLSCCIKCDAGQWCGIPPAHQILRSCHLALDTQNPVTVSPWASIYSCFTWVIKSC